MNKKILGIKIATILQFFVCVALAFIIWFIVQYTNSQADANNTAALDYCGHLLI